MVKIMLDKERTLRLTMTGVFAFEEATGKELVQAMKDGLTKRDAMALLWACLIHEDKNLTFDALNTIVTIDQFPLVSKAILDYMTEAGNSSPLVATS